MKCIEDEIPFDLPDGWAWARIKKVSVDLPYGTSKKSNSSGKVAVLRMGNLQDGEIDYSDLVYSSDEADIEKYYLLENDILFNRTNSAEWVGKTSIYRGETPAIYAGYLIRIRTPLCGEYLNAVMNSAYAKNYCIRVKTDAVNQSNINAQKLGMFLVPVAPIEEQHRIVTSFKQTFELTQCIQSEKNELSALIQSAKAKILDLAIRGQLVLQDPADEPASVLLERIRSEKEEMIQQGKIKRDKKESVIFKGEDNSYYGDLPESWSVATLSSLTHPSLLNDGDWILSENMVPIGDVKLVQLGSVGSMRYVDKGFKYLTTETFNALGCTQIYPGFMLINRIVSDRLCACILPSIDGKLITTVDTCWIAPCENWYSLEYLMYAVSSPAFQSLVLLNSAGTTRKRISKNNLISLPIPFPPLQEQQRIVEAVDVAFAQLDTIANSL